MEEEKTMAEPLRNDEPLSSMRFPESPEAPRKERPLSTAGSPEPAGLLPETLPDRPIGEWPEELPETSSHRDRMNDAGEKVGTAIGTVVNQTRELSGRAKDRVQDLQQRFRVIAGRQSTQLQERVSEFSDEAQERASEFADEARREMRQWESRARYYARNYPFQFIGGVAATCFVIGFLLRLWRDE